jgi:hypothetical protein
VKPIPTQEREGASIGGLKILVHKSDELLLQRSNSQRATMQTPQGVDAKHGVELSPVLEFLEEMEDRPA